MPARFLVRAFEEPRAHAHPAEAETPLEAAILYVERWTPAEEAGEVSVTVVDCETGNEQCFRIALTSGEVGPC